MAIVRELAYVQTMLCTDRALRVLRFTLRVSAPEHDDEALTKALTSVVVPCATAEDAHAKARGCDESHAHASSAGDICAEEDRAIAAKLLADEMIESEAYAHACVRMVSFFAEVDKAIPAFCLRFYTSAGDSSAPKGSGTHEKFVAAFELSRDKLQELDARAFTQTLPAEVDPAYADWFFHQVPTRASLDAERRASSRLRAYIESHAHAAEVDAPAAEALLAPMPAPHAPASTPMPASAPAPLFSIIVPLYHTPLQMFSELMASICAQTFEDFELILVLASAEDHALRARAQEFTQMDPRVKLIVLEHNEGISKNTAAGARLARGQFLLFCDHDDTIEPDCLFWYASAIAHAPTIDVIYCDEDKISPEGEYVFPFCKPDWSPVLALGFNYVCHMLGVRRSIYTALLPDILAFDTAQDWYLMLMSSLSAREVYHVRRILYHWRMSASSTAQDATQKDAVVNASKAVVAKYLSNQAPALGISHLETAPVRVWYKLSALPPARAFPRVVLWGSRAFTAEQKEEIQSVLCEALCTDPAISADQTHDQRQDQVPDQLRDQLFAHIQDFSGRRLSLSDISDFLSKDPARPFMLIHSSISRVEPAFVRSALAYLEFPSVGIVASKDVFQDGCKAAGALYINTEGVHVVDQDFTRDNMHIRGYEAVPHEVDVVNSSILALAPRAQSALHAACAQELAGPATRYGMDTLAQDVFDRLLPMLLSILMNEQGYSVIEHTSYPVEISFSHGYVPQLRTKSEQACAKTLDSYLRASHPSCFVPPHHFYSTLLDGDASYKLGH